jgi:hypothetical protein
VVALCGPRQHHSCRLSFPAVSPCAVASSLAEDGPVVCVPCLQCLESTKSSTCFCPLIDSMLAPCFGFAVLGSIGTPFINFTTCVAPSCYEASNEESSSPIQLILFCISTFLDRPSLSRFQLSNQYMIGELSYLSIYSKPCSPL